jgi:hypothetical protein
MAESEQALGFTLVEDMNFERAELTLYGLDDDSILAKTLYAKGGCRWWALACHARAFWAWLGEKNGETTNGGTMTALIGSIGIIVALQ